MDELPELPFEKVLSYLSLEEVIKLRAVSKSCLWKIDNYKVKHLCYSRLSIGHIYEKHRWISGVFAQNFISSSQFKSFFKTFGQTILSRMKHLRLYEPDPYSINRTAFTDALESFGQLEELDLIGKCPLKRSRILSELELSLPMLKSVRFERVYGIEKLTLNAPMLKRVKLNWSLLSLDLVHGESVERLLTTNMNQVRVENLKKLKYFYLWPRAETDFPLLFGLKELKAIHLIDDTNELIDHNDYSVSVRELFDLKQQYGRTDLEIYYLGCILSGPDDPAMAWDLDFLNGEIFEYWAVDRSSMADEVPFWTILDYAAIEHLGPELQAIILNRFTDLREIQLLEPIQDIDRFLNFLKNFSHISNLQIGCDQPQELFDRLSECCIQGLRFLSTPSNLEFLRLKQLIELSTDSSNDLEMIRRALKELKFLESFRIFFDTSETFCEILIESSERFEVYIDGRKKLDTRDLNALYQVIEQNITGELDDMQVD